jgi:uncharacterized coiled-coil DUF342 family protein
MQNQEQISQMLIEHSGEIKALKQRAITTEERVKENSALLTGIHELAANVKSLTEEVKRNSEKLDSGLQGQGRRIGALESAFIEMSTLKTKVDCLDTRVGEIERAPAKKWDKFVWLIVGGITAAVVAYFAGKYL